MATRPALVIIGPSASGKSSVVQELQRRGLLRVHPTWTTRPRRPDEAGGALEHCFVAEPDFDALVVSGFFIGTVTLPGLPYRYALPHLTLRGDGPIDTIMARAPFLEPLSRFVPDQLVYQIADTPARARKRLLERGCDVTELAARVDCYVAEADAGRRLACRFFTNDGTVTELADAIAAALRLDIPSPCTPTIEVPA